MSIRDILAHKGDRIVSVSPDTSISEVAAILEKERIGAVLVLDGPGRLVGLLSERDLVTAIARQGSTCLDLAASDLMLGDVVTCALDDGITRAMSLMTDRRVRHLPVLAEGALTGVISIGDVVKHRLTEVETEAAALREYIATA
jgi:CBS domain-containing protein